MSENQHASRVVRFGLFEVDLEAGELRKNGLKVQLQEQPFRMLELLLEHPGGLVTREEVRQKLWPADTFVEFDRALNTAVNKIREALGDSATQRLGGICTVTAVMPQSNEKALQRGDG